MENSTTRKPGRPKLGNVLFARRVKPSLIPSLERLLYGNPYQDLEGKIDVPAIPIADEAMKQQNEKMGGDIIKLLDNVESLTKQVEDYKAGREAYLRATDNDKIAYWRDRALRCEGSGIKKEYDQT